jgi:hypothetical protein
MQYKTQLRKACKNRYESPVKIAIRKPCRKITTGLSSYETCVNFSLRVDTPPPDELRVTNGGDRFLLYDNEDSDHRIIILSSDDNLHRLPNSEHWHCDGAFKARLIMIISFQNNPFIHNFVLFFYSSLLYCFTSCIQYMTVYADVHCR